MYRVTSFLLLLFLLMAGRPISAQKIIEKMATVRPGDQVFLNLRYATNIRVRAGGPGQVSLKAAVNINQNRLNDALVLTQPQAAGEVQFLADLDRTQFARAQPTDCPDGGSYFGNSYNSSRDEEGNPQGGYRLCVEVDYDVTVPAGVSLRVQTISGNIDIQGLTGTIEAKSISGFVDVTWAPAAAALALKTVTGEVYADPAVVFSNRRKNPTVGYQLRGTLGTDGPLIRLESVSNDIFFRRRQ